MEFANQDRSPRLYTAATRGLGAQPVPTLDLYDRTCRASTRAR